MHYNTRCPNGHLHRAPSRLSKMGLNGHRGRAGVCPCAGWHRVGQWAARGIKGSLGGYAAGRRTLPALDLVYYQEAQYSRLLPVTASRYVTLPVSLNGGYFRYPAILLITRYTQPTTPHQTPPTG